MKLAICKEKETIINKAVESSHKFLLEAKDFINTYPLTHEDKKQLKLLLSKAEGSINTHLRNLKHNLIHGDKEPIYYMFMLTNSLEEKIAKLERKNQGAISYEPIYQHFFALFYEECVSNICNFYQTYGSWSDLNAKYAA